MTHSKTHSRTHRKESAYRRELQEIHDRMLGERKRAIAVREAQAADMVAMLAAANIDQPVVIPDASTNWHRNGEGTIRRPQPMMFGEGIGNEMGLERPKYTVWKTYEEVTDEDLAAISAEEEIQRAERRKAGVEKARITREKNRKRKERIAEKVENGEMLGGQRIFRVDFSLGDWEERSKKLDGMPPAVIDVAGTEYGVLLMVRVHEEEDGKKIGLEEPMKDVMGRKFFLTLTDRERIESIFGRVDWRRPLTEREARQFGVDF